MHPQNHEVQNNLHMIVIFGAVNLDPDFLKCMGTSILVAIAAVRFSPVFFFPPRSSIFIPQPLSRHYSILHYIYPCLTQNDILGLST